MEDHTAEPVASALSDQLIELFVRADDDPVPHLHALGRDRQAPGLFLYAYLGTLGQLGLNLCGENRSLTPTNISFGAAPH
jgi:hypothetical protein